MSERTASFTLRRRPAFVLLTMVSLLTAVWSSSSTALTVEVSPVVPAQTAPPAIGAPHPSVPGMFYWGERSWGRYVEQIVPARYGVIHFTTQFYTTSTSINRIAEARRRVAPLGLTVLVRESGTIQEFFPDPSMIEGGISVGCVLQEPDGRITGAMEKPCLHNNVWSSGPRNGFSWCDLRSCMTTGHRDQGGYQRFLAHNEVWSWVTWTPGQRWVEFEACGPPCDAACTPGSPGCPTPCTPGSPGCPTPCTPGSPGCPTPCTPGSPGCPTSCTPGSPGCDDVCRDPSCAPAPPVHCDVFPSDPRCVEGTPDDVRFRVVLDVPSMFAAKGTLLEQGASVASVTLLCGTRVCAPSSSGLDPSEESLTGRLLLDASSSRYRACRSSSQTACSFLPRLADTSVRLSAGDRVSAYFFSPTPTGESMLVSVASPVGTAQTFRWEAVYEIVPVSCPAGECYDWVFTGEYRRVPDRVIEVPVEVVTADGRNVPARGLVVPVIGSVGN